MEILHVFGLEAKARMLAGGLAQGERKLLDVAIAYALKPKLLFLDEPTSGVSTREKAPIMDTITAVVRSEHISAAIIEHDMDVVFNYSDRIVAMHQGTILADGTPDEIRRNEKVHDDADRHAGAPAVSTPGPMLELERVETYRGPAQILRSISLAWAPASPSAWSGATARARRRPSTAIMGLLAGAERRHPIQGPGRHATAGPPARPAGHRLRARGLRDLPRPDRRGKLPDHRLARPGGGGDRPTIRCSRSSRRSRPS